LPIYTNSRYTTVNLYNRDGNTIYRRRKRIIFSEKDAVYHRYTSFDRLDLLAQYYYGDKQLYWVFLDANTQYRSELDINVGDTLLVPSFDEVRKWI